MYSLQKTNKQTKAKLLTLLYNLLQLLSFEHLIEKETSS